MKKRFKSILAKKRKENGTAVLICAAALSVSLGTLVGCSNVQENMENSSGPLGTEDYETKDIQIENAQTDETLPESESSSSKTEQSLDDCSIMIGNISLSIYENKHDILAKLDESGWDYSEFEPDDPEESKYDTCYNIDGWMQMYFLDDECVRLRAIEVDGSNRIVQTARGVHPGSTYSQMVDSYGDSYETHTYAGKAVYTIYRYSVNDCVCEFGIQGDDSYSIYNVDIYAPSQAPIYDYGEELIN